MLSQLFLNYFIKLYIFKLLSQFYYLISTNKLDFETINYAKSLIFEISKNLVINRITAIVICTESERWKECKNEKLFPKVENIWLQSERFSSFVRLCTNIGFFPGSFIQVTGCTFRREKRGAFRDCLTWNIFVSCSRKCSKNLVPDR